MEDTSSLISQQRMEHLWTSVRADTSDPHEGIFGPSSLSWKVNREAALFLGAGRATLLQLAHPWVAAALDQHSNLRADPLARFHNTFRVVFTMIFGTLERALAASRHLYLLHTQIQGELPASVAAYACGSRYKANVDRLYRILQLRPLRLHHRTATAAHLLERSSFDPPICGW